MTEHTEEQWTFTGPDGLSRLIHIFMGGFMSGAYTALANVAPGNSHIARDIVATICRDPAAMLAGRGAAADVPRRADA